MQLFGNCFSGFALPASRRDELSRAGGLVYLIAAFAAPQQLKTPRDLL